MKQTPRPLITFVAFLVVAGVMLAIGSPPSRARTTSGTAEGAPSVPGAVQAVVSAALSLIAPPKPRMAARVAAARDTQADEGASEIGVAGMSGSSPADDAPVDPDESVSDYDNRPEQREWRTQWIIEEHNAEWTQRMQDELQARAKAHLQGEIEILEPSCRETTCMMHIKFADDVDVKAFQDASKNPDFHYEFQSLDPHYTGDGFNNADYEYELIIKRGAVD